MLFLVLSDLSGLFYLFYLSGEPDSKMRKREAIRPNLAKLATRGGRGVDFFAAVAVKTLSRLSGLFYLFWLFCSEQAGQEGRLPRPVVVVAVHILSGLSGLFYLFYLLCSEQASSR